MSHLYEGHRNILKKRDRSVITLKTFALPEYQRLPLKFLKGCRCWFFTRIILGSILFESGGRVLGNRCVNLSDNCRLANTF